MFTTNWHLPDQSAWQAFLEWRQPARILEIGAWEGATTQLFAQWGSVTVIDSWSSGGRDRFDYNTQDLGITVHQEHSHIALRDLWCGGSEFDLIYVDASHYTHDVLADSVLAWQLLADQGTMVWDDLLARKEKPDRPQRFPRFAVEAFVQSNWSYLEVLDTEFTAEKLAVRKHSARTPS